MSQVMTQTDTETVLCYCCNEFTEHEVYYGDEESPTYYQCCECDCTINDDEDQIIRPEND